jgi:hypothetical protein
MNASRRFRNHRKLTWIALLLILGITFGVRKLYSRDHASQGFPNGFDAVQAAPASHHVVFENAFVRVLNVTLPPAGSAEPMHYHRWPSLFLGYDTGGTTAHIRYHTPNGPVRDQPSQIEPIHAGVWSANWMNPEPMHSIEVVTDPKPGPGAPPGWLRIEFKFALPK